MAEDNAAADPVDAYVRQYLESHSRESIREQLLAAGYEPERVDAALARAAAHPSSAGRTAFKVFWISCGVLVVLAVLAFGVCIYSLTRQSGF
jgi:type VI protein secretion system component VasF